MRITGGVIDEGKFSLQIGSLFANDPDGDGIFWTSSDARFTVRDGQIILNAPLDYENAAERLLPVTFRATDTGTPPLTTNIDVVIEVRDVNEAYPQLQSAVLAIVDGTPAGTLLDDLDALDADSLQVVKYRLRSGDTSFFTIDSDSGELRLASQANMAQKSQYKIFVEAFDNGTPSFTTTTQLIVNVDPSNLFEPEFDANQTLSFGKIYRRERGLVK